MIDKKNAPSNLAESEETNNQEQNKNTNFIQKLKAEIQTKSMNFNANDTVFPTYGLPQVILDFGLEISEVYGVPVEFPVLSALCAVSSAIRKKFVFDSGKYRNFGQLWLMFVAPPGVGKTEPVAAAFRPLQRLDNLSYDGYQLELSNWKMECSEAKQNKSQEPEKSFFKQCLIDDFTPESLYQTMFRNNGAVSLCRDELSGWFADFGRYNKSGEINRYLSIFHNVKFPINKAFYIAYNVCVLGKDFSSYNYSDQLGLNQMTCWKFRKRIQDCMLKQNAEKGKVAIKTILMSEY